MVSIKRVAATRPAQTPFLAADWARPDSAAVRASHRQIPCLYVCACACVCVNQHFEVHYARRTRRHLNCVPAAAAARNVPASAAGPNRAVISCARVRRSALFIRAIRAIRGVRAFLRDLHISSWPESNLS